ncbi:MAG: hypothetical protein Q4A90_00160 [Streptococcus sp.]|nr:hypothetical protein [Streptococcus sp.]
MGKRIKFSPLRARVVLMLLPMLGVISLGLCLLCFIFITFVAGFSFWIGDSLYETFSMIAACILIQIRFVEFIYRIIKDNLLINSNVQELRDCYPELEDSWDNLNDADYLDQHLQILVYGDHLICYRTFDIAYLPECSKISASMTTYIFRRYCRQVKRVHFFATYLDGSKSELRTNELRDFVKIDQNAHKDSLLGYIVENYDYIEVETID